MVVQVVVMKNLMMMLDQGQPRVVLDEGLKDIYEQLYRADLLRAYSQLVIRLLMDEVHEPKSAFSEFMDLSDTNYKFMNLKMHSHSLWTYVTRITS